MRECVRERIYARDSPRLNRLLIEDETHVCIITFIYLRTRLSQTSANRSSYEVVCAVGGQRPRDKDKAVATISGARGGRGRRGQSD